MKKLYVSQSLIDVESRKELLDQARIPATIKNQRSAMLGGEVPFVEVFPELWVLNDEDFDRARTLLKDWEYAKPLETTKWTCSGCGELHQKEFTTCWNCGLERRSKNSAWSHQDYSILTRILYRWLRKPVWFKLNQDFMRASNLYTQISVFYTPMSSTKVINGSILIFLLLGLPPLGMVLSGQALPHDLILFPIPLQPGEASLSWPVFGLLALLISGTVAPFLWRYGKTRCHGPCKSASTKEFPWWGWMGGGWTAFAWIFSILFMKGRIFAIIPSPSIC